MFKNSRSTRHSVRPRVGWLGLTALAFVGCREYTCFDTATCTYPVEAGASNALGDGGSGRGADASSGDAAATIGSEPTIDASATQAPSDADASEPGASAASTTLEPVDSLNTVADARDAGGRETLATDASAQPSVNTATDGSSSPSIETSMTDSSNASSGTGSQQVDGPAPSNGCGKAAPNTGSSSSPLSVSGHSYYVKLPPGYDPNTPYPVVIMFNPTGNPISWAEAAAGFETAAPNWIRVYPHMANQSSGWTSSEVPFFESFYERITSDYCMDTTRIFAAGESSGGDFVGILGCEHADKLRGVAPCATKVVRGYDLDSGTLSCTGQVNAVVIHGKNDSVVGPANGPRMRDFYKGLNHCEEVTTPVVGYTDELSNCVRYEGCDEGYDTYWCSHSDPNYSDTNHGWPAFAANMLIATWSAL